jgi:charged multivesicular body protein 6
MELLLKKKRYYEQNLDKTDGQLDNLDQMVHNIEYTQIEHQVIKGKNNIKIKLFFVI